MLKYLIKTTKTPDDDTSKFGLDDDTANDDDTVVPVVRI
jgi:hypothetical protein